MKKPMKKPINEIYRMQQLAGIKPLNELKVNNPNLNMYNNMDKGKLIDYLAKLTLNNYEDYINDFETWEQNMFDDFDYEGIKYLIRNFTVGDEEDSRHENEIGKSIEEFQQYYNIDYEQAYIVNLLVNKYLKQDLGL